MTGDILSAATQANKALGQHFLTDKNIISNIIKAIDPQSHERIYEIGPGPGAITQPLLESGAPLTIFEKDTRFAHAWAAHEASRVGQLHVVETDALEVDWSKQEVPAQVVGNLPYNVGTQIVLNLLPYLPRYRQAVFMLQQEVIDRMLAQPGSKTWGRLGVWCQLYADVTQVMRVPPQAFRPPPKVDSAIVRLVPLAQPRFDVDVKKLSRLINQAFGQRRKMLRASLKGMLTPEQIESVGIAPTERPEQLGLSELCILAGLLD